MIWLKKIIFNWLFEDLNGSVNKKMYEMQASLEDDSKMLRSRLNEAYNEMQGRLVKLTDMMSKASEYSADVKRIAVAVDKLAGISSEIPH
jgi:uncharacterized lipoprotein YehR (DUF1307 family)